MAESISVIGSTKEEKYQSLIPQIKNLIEGEPDTIANIANVMAALKFSMNFFWVGIYFVKNSNNSTAQELVLGPFQGPIACTRIAYGKGVCGKAWESKSVIIVDDVDAFPGHIACSTLSKSEIVIPIKNKNNEITMVLDIDSELLSNFDTTDKYYLNEIGKLIASLNS
ncbi:MAG: GAF domain-containing protein [Bacteroidia bacterium]